MRLDDLEKEEKRDKVKQRRLFIWAVMPSMAVLCSFTLYGAINHFFGGSF